MKLTDQKPSQGLEHPVSQMDTPNLVSLIKAKYSQQHLPPRFQNRTWVGIPPQIRDVVRDCVGSLQTEHPKGMLLMGAVGSGKTSLVLLALDLYIEKVLATLGINDDWWIEYDDGPIRVDLQTRITVGYQRLKDELDQAFFTVSDLIRILRDHNTKESDGYAMPDELKKKIVILDDWGREHDHPWNRALLDEWINYRWSNQLPVWITTNYTEETMRDLAQQQRMVDRILDPKWNAKISLGNRSRRTCRAVA